MSTATRSNSSSGVTSSFPEIFSMDLEDRGGHHHFSVRLLQEFGEKTPYLTPEKIQELWTEYQKHDVLFSDYTRGKFEPFLLLLMDERSVWLEVYDETNDIPAGVMMASNVIPKFDARGHFTFWDGGGSGREPLTLKAMGWFFDRFDLHRMTARVPVYQRGVIRYIERLGFKKEGEMREAAPYKGEWVPLAFFGILRREFEEVYDG